MNMGEFKALQDRVLSLASKIEKEVGEEALARKTAEERFVEYWDVMAEQVHASIKAKGGAEKDRNDGEMIALIHAELSEVLEALRKDNPPSKNIQGFSEVEEELADVVNWIMGFSVLRGYRTGAAIVAKHTYNTGRPYKHGKKF